MTLDPTILSPAWDKAPLESRFKEAMFRRYEPLMTIAVQRAPEETEFACPPQLSPNTFIARFRDAFLSLKRFEWNRSPTGTTIPMDKLRSLDGKFILHLNPLTNSVWFRAKQAGPREVHKIKAAWRAGAPSSTHGTQPQAPWVDPTADEVEAIALLLHTRRLVGPFQLATQLPSKTILSLQARYDIVLRWEEGQGTTTIT